MPSFPRVKKPFRSTKPRGRGGLIARSQRGVTQGRSTTARGVRWQEQWRTLRAGDPDVEALLEFVRRHRRLTTVLDIDHLQVKGSGLAPNGTGSSGVTVSGASQTGTSLDTTGWPVSTSEVVRQGDVIRVAGIDVVLWITADAASDGSGNATLSVEPSILTAPADGVSITTTGVLFKARIVGHQIPEGGPGEYLDGMRVDFEEAP